MSEVLPAICGILTLGLIVGNQRISIGFALGLGYAIGLGILGQIMLWTGWHQIPIERRTIVLALYAYMSAVSLLFLCRCYFFPSEEINFSKAKEAPYTLNQRCFMALMLAFIIYQLAFISLNAIFIPVQQADAFSVHAFRAKEIFYTHSLNFPSEGSFLWYPLQLHLTTAWVALSIGQWQEGWAQAFMVFNCVAFLGLTYDFMIFFADRITAIITIALLLTSLLFVNHAHIIYGDFLVMLYTMSSLMLMAMGISLRKVRFILLAGLMAGFAAQVKFQGIEYWFLGIIILGRYIFVKEFWNLGFTLKSFAGFTLPFIVVESNFILYKAHFKVTEIWNQQPLIFHLQGLAKHLGIMFFILFDNLFLSANWNILWFLLIVVMWVNRKTKKPFVIMFFSFALSLFFVDYFKYVLFPRSFSYMIHDIDNVSRFILHFFPLCPILIGLSIHDYLKKRRV